MAYESVLYVTNDVTFGWLVRGIHWWAGHLLLALVTIHLARVFFTRAFRAPRQANWVLGLLILPLVIAFQYTGELLPWDQIAYWKSVEGIETARTIPIIGAALAHLSGGGSISGVTLMRYSTLHVVVLPWIVFFLLAAHLRLARRQGKAPPWRHHPHEGDGKGSAIVILERGLPREKVDAIQGHLEQSGCSVQRIEGTERIALRVEGLDAHLVDTIVLHPLVEEIVPLANVQTGPPFFPQQVFRILCAILLAGGALLLAAAYLPPLIGEPNNPFLAPDTVRPSWYVTWYHQLLAVLPGSLHLLAPVILVSLPFVALFWPLVDNNADERGTPRRVWLTPLAGGLAVAFYGGLTLWGILS
jgi:quinol-cytochrome oxidoreductase complex cytochrome b subunit